MCLAPGSVFNAVHETQLHLQHLLDENRHHIS